MFFAVGPVKILVRRAYALRCAFSRPSGSSLQLRFYRIRLKRRAPFRSVRVDEYGFELVEQDGCLIAAFRGDLSTHRYSEFRNDYNDICRSLAGMETKWLIIDLTETTFFSSLFIGIMMKLAVFTWNQNGLVALCGLSNQLQDLMKKLMLLEPNAESASRLQHFATRAEAIAALGTS